MRRSTVRWLYIILCTNTELCVLYDYDILSASLGPRPIFIENNTAWYLLCGL